MNKDTPEDASRNTNNDEPKESPEPAQIKDTDLEKVSGGWWHGDFSPQT